jgi:hypothetical protein
MRRSLRAAGIAAVISLVVLTQSTPVAALGVGAYHILPLPGYYAKTGRLPPGGGDGPLNYYGGSVFESVKVVSVMWGSGVNQQTVQQIPAFSAAMVNSTYMDQLSPQYDTFLRGINHHKGTKQHIQRGSYLGQVQIAPHNTSLSLTDADVQNELRYQIKHGALPLNDLDTLYMIYFPSNVTINIDGLISCQQFGAYHFAKNDTKLASNNVFYSVEPECGAGFDFLTFAASHEFIEATTDNVPTPGSNPDFPQAWNDVHGEEAGDLCGDAGTLSDGTHSWTVTQYYLNTIEACSTGNYQSP